MKTILALIGLLLLTQTSFAANYYYQPQLTSADSRGETCPQISEIAVQDDLAKGLVHLSLKSNEKSFNVTTDKNYEASHCISDMVCPTSVIFNQLENKLISLERNNDGNYPTTNEPGFSTLQIGMYNVVGKTLTWTAFCYYRL